MADEKRVRLLEIVAMVAFASLVSALGYVCLKVQQLDGIAHDVQSLNIGMATRTQIELLRGRIEYLHPPSNEKAQRESKTFAEYLNLTGVPKTADYPWPVDRKIKDVRASKNSPGMTAVETDKQAPTVVGALAAGRVVYSGRDPDQPGYRLVAVEDDQGLVWRHGHLGETKVREEQRVAYRETIGVGSPSSDVCVTFGVLVPGTSTPISPASLPPKEGAK